MHDFNLSEVIPIIREHTLKVLDKNKGRIVYNSEGRLVRLEQSIEIIAKDENLSSDEFLRLQLLLYTHTSFIM